MLSLNSAFSGGLDSCFCCRLMYLVSFMTMMVKQTTVKVHTFETALKKDGLVSWMLVTSELSLMTMPTVLTIAEG